jgi:hypothetical protein
MCIPSFGKSKIMWHTHPRGMPSAPSAEDLAMLIVEEEDGPCFLHLLFCTEGIWVMHRTHCDKPYVKFTEGGSMQQNNKQLQKMQHLVDRLTDRVIVFMKRTGMFREPAATSSTSSTSMSMMMMSKTHNNIYMHQQQFHAPLSGSSRGSNSNSNSNELFLTDLQTFVDDIVVECSGTLSVDFYRWPEMDKRTGAIQAPLNISLPSHLVQRIRS